MRQNAQIQVVARLLIAGAMLVSMAAPMAASADAPEPTQDPVGPSACSTRTIAMMTAEGDPVTVEINPCSID